MDSRFSSISLCSFDPSINFLLPFGIANLSSKIGLSKGPRPTGTACPFERVWRSLQAVAPSARVKSVRALAAGFRVPCNSDL